MRIPLNWPLPCLLIASCLWQGAGLAAEPETAKPGLSKPELQAALELTPVRGMKASMQGITQAVLAAFGELDFVRPLTAIEAGRNDSNPVWSLDGNLIAFERSIGDKREVVVSRPDGSQVQRIYFQLSEENNVANVDPKAPKAPALLIPGFAEDPSFNTGVSWGRDGKRLVFMSNGGEGNYDLYSQELGGGVQRLTNHKEKDGLAQWSPVADQIVFISGRTGKGDAYLLETKTKSLLQLTRGDKPYLYPRWSPDGKKIALFYGSSENHDIYIMDNPKKPLESLRALTSWSYDDLRPSWSPDGKKIAFYTNYNESGDSKTWSLVVVASDGSDGISGNNLIKHIVATDVMPDIEQGPAWLPDSQGLVYVKDEKREFNPIYLVDLQSKSSIQLKTGTKMNSDLTCSSDGLIAFRAQVDQWDQIFLAKLKK